MYARWITSMLIVGILAGGCGTYTVLSALDNGIEGIVVSGPQCPLTTIPPPPECEDKPIQATVIVRDEASGVEVTRFTSNADGTFRVVLDPGRYTLDPQPAGDGSLTAEDQAVQVVNKSFANVEINYDTGIR